MNRRTWLQLKYLLSQSTELNKLVCSWVDDDNPAAFITRWENRYFLLRLILRAFNTLCDTSEEGHRVDLEGDRYTVMCRVSRQSSWAGYEE